jgi:hypothetical protein
MYEPMNKKSISIKGAGCKSRRNPLTDSGDRGGGGFCCMVSDTFQQIVAKYERNTGEAKEISAGMFRDNSLFCRCNRSYPIQNMVWTPLPKQTCRSIEGQASSLRRQFKPISHFESFFCSLFSALHRPNPASGGSPPTICFGSSLKGALPKNCLPRLLRRRFVCLATKRVRCGLLCDTLASLFCGRIALRKTGRRC